MYKYVHSISVNKSKLRNFRFSTFGSLILIQLNLLIKANRMMVFFYDTNEKNKCF